MKDPRVYPSELSLVAILDPILLGSTIMHSCQIMPGFDTKHGCQTQVAKASHVCQARVNNKQTDDKMIYFNYLIVCER